MQEFQTIGLMNTELKLLNNWRIFFQVSTLAQICNPEGPQIQKCFLNKPYKGKVDKENPSTCVAQVKENRGNEVSHYV
jgi:hypothetical protein